MSTGSTVLASGTGTLAVLFWGLSTHTVIRPGVANAKALWRVCACVCACIALSAALDLDSRLLSWLRTTAKISGWYEWRRPIQAVALMAGGVCLWISLRAMLALKPSSSTMASFFECCFNGLLDFGQLVVVQAGLMAFDGCLDELAFIWGQFRALDRTVGTLHSGGIRDC